MLCDDLQVLCVPLKLAKELDNVIQIGLRNGKFNRPTVIVLEQKNDDAKITVYGKMVKE